MSGRHERSGLCAMTAMAVLASCGKAGPVQPPAPRGPLPPASVEARQLGDRVEVALTVPKPRGNDAAQTVRTTEILRVAYPKGRPAPAEPDAFRVRGEVVATVDAEYAKPGARVVIADPALGQLADRGIGWTLRYGVRVRDQRGRPSPLVVARDLTTVTPVPPPTALAAQASADGVRLTWQPPATSEPATYNVYRGPVDGQFPERPLNVQPLTTPGDLDATAEPGKAYRYTVRAVAAAGTPYRESASSNEVVVDASDRFAPASPEGLVAVQEGAAVRLLWNPGVEADLDGYRVYRQLGDEGPWLPVGAAVVKQPGFVDTGVPAASVARYRVTAVDRAQPPNESAPSSVVEVRVAAEPAAAETP
jgi:hypothetical protein